jgi:hypothetical protein
MLVAVAVAQALIGRKLGLAAAVVQVMVREALILFRANLDLLTQAVVLVGQTPPPAHLVVQVSLSFVTLRI